MEKEIAGKRGHFTPEELDYVLCALLKYQAELRGRTSLMQRFANPQHMENHRAKIALGERLLEDLS
jgi:ribosomal protein L29